MKPTKSVTAKPRALRPRQVRELYGIPQSTLRVWCCELPPADRLPSMLIPGRKGNRGVRLLMVDALEEWLAKHRAK